MSTLGLLLVVLVTAASAVLDRDGGRRVLERLRFAMPSVALVWAHAAVRGLRLLTRDAARYHTYFPTVELIAPA